jgi:hypothetical protein
MKQTIYQTKQKRKPHQRVLVRLEKHWLNRFIQQQ